FRQTLSFLCHSVSSCLAQTVPSRQLFWHPVVRHRSATADGGGNPLQERQVFHSRWLARSPRLCQRRASISREGVPRRGPLDEALRGDGVGHPRPNQARLHLSAALLMAPRLEAGADARGGPPSGCPARPVLRGRRPCRAGEHARAAPSRDPYILSTLDLLRRAEDELTAALRKMLRHGPHNLAGMSDDKANLGKSCKDEGQNVGEQPIGSLDMAAIIRTSHFHRDQSLKREQAHLTHSDCAPNSFDALYASWLGMDGRDFIAYRTFFWKGRLHLFDKDQRPEKNCERSQQQIHTVKFYIERAIELLEYLCNTGGQPTQQRSIFQSNLDNLQELRENLIGLGKVNDHLRAYSLAEIGHRFHERKELGNHGREVKLTKHQRQWITRQALIDLLSVYDHSTPDEQNQVEHFVLNSVVARQASEVKPACVKAWGAGRTGFGSEGSYYDYYRRHVEDDAKSAARLEAPATPPAGAAQPPELAAAAVEATAAPLRDAPGPAAAPVEVPATLPVGIPELPEARAGALAAAPVDAPGRPEGQAAPAGSPAAPPADAAELPEAARAVETPPAAAPASGEEASLQGPVGAGRAEDAGSAPAPPRLAAGAAVGKWGSWSLWSCSPLFFNAPSSCVCPQWRVSVGSRRTAGAGRPRARGGPLRGPSEAPAAATAAPPRGVPGSPAAPAEAPVEAPAAAPAGAPGPLAGAPAAWAVLPVDLPEPPAAVSAPALRARLWRRRRPSWPRARQPRWLPAGRRASAGAAALAFCSCLPG
ncbi:unnamed protein product, partial [Prorocentrum cordatum]